MKVIIEKPEPNTSHLKSRPIWLTVDKETRTVSLRDDKGKMTKTYSETTVRANILIVDYKDKADAMRIAEKIQKALT